MDNLSINKINKDENVKIVNETVVKKSKFTIVKSTDNKLADDKNSVNNLPLTPVLLNKNEFDWNFDTSSFKSDSDFNLNNSKTKLHQLSQLEINLNEEEEEDDDDDVFNESLLPFNLVDKNQSNRENEGQDTITSLSNNIYLKQLAKIRKKSSNKSKSSISSKSNEVQNLNITQSNSRSASPDFVSSKTNLRSIFKNRDSFSSKKSIRIEKGTLIINDENELASTDITPSNLNKIRKISSRSSLLDIKIEKDATNTSEQVYQVLKDAIDKNDSELSKKFIQQVVETVKIQQIKKQRKMDKDRKACFMIEILVFLLIFIMAIFLIKNVIAQLEIIDNKKSIYFFNSTNLTMI
jgi:hypothetical protein